jgi:DNA-damage-inducible protein J
MGVDVMKKLKDSTVKARINSELKNSVDEKLLKVGLDSSTVIRMLYSYIEYYNKIPFDLNIPNIPNKKTIEVIEDIMEGRNLIEFSSIDELRKELDSEND